MERPVIGDARGLPVGDGRRLHRAGTGALGTVPARDGGGGGLGRVGPCDVGAEARSSPIFRRLCGLCHGDLLGFLLCRAVHRAVLVVHRENDGRSRRDPPRPVRRRSGHQTRTLRHRDRRLQGGDQESLRWIPGDRTDLDAAGGLPVVVPPDPPFPAIVPPVSDRHRHHLAGQRGADHRPDPRRHLDRSQDCRRRIPLAGRLDLVPRRRAGDDLGRAADVVFLDPSLG